MRNPMRKRGDTEQKKEKPWKGVPMLVFMLGAHRVASTRLIICTCKNPTLPRGVSHEEVPTGLKNHSRKSTFRTVMQRFTFS